MNPGFEPQEIELLKKECREEGQSFVYCEDEDEMQNTGEVAHFQFVGEYEGREVIYDAVLCTLRLNHSSLVYEQAIEEVQKSFPKYLPVEERPDSYKIDPAVEEEAETLLTEIMESLEDEQEIKVAEQLEIDPDFEFGVGLDVALNVEEITDEVVEQFIRDFNNNTLKLDPTLYSFSSLEDEE